MSYINRNLNSSMSSRSSKPVNKTQSRARPSAKRNESGWNTYLTDDTYKISQESVLKKKQLYVSKHNILLESNINKSAPRKTKIIRKKIVQDDDSFISDLADNNLHVDGDALDFLDSEDFGDSMQQFNNPISNVTKSIPIHTQRNDYQYQTYPPKPPIPRSSITSASNSNSTALQLPELDEDMTDIIDQISVLSDELKYYEELSGKKSIYNTNVSSVKLS